MQTEKESHEKLASLWDKFSSVYTSLTEPFNSVLSLQLALQTRANFAKNVIEVGCGSGVGSLVIRPFLAPGTTYCCCDLSKGMLEVFKKRYESSDFTRNPDNSLEFGLEEPAAGPKIKPKIGREKGVSLSVYKGNSECLSFADGCFDSYIASASLYVVNNPMNMIRESYRVLRPGGIAGFSVFGKLKNSTYFNVAMEILHTFAAKYGVELPKTRSLFYLGEDEPGLIKMFKEAGYSKVKLWHESTIYDLTAEQYVEEKLFPLDSVLKAFPPEGKKAFCEALKTEVQKRFIDGDEMISIDFMMIVCTK